MSKNCLIYETLNGVKEMSVKKDGDLMTLSGVFGVCGVRNNNQRVYETSNYSKMVSEMKERIKNEGGIPGELEHPQVMNITLENVSHKITDINIDENGLVTGSITLLNTPKGKIAQAIVEGGLPLLVGSPGFSQAKLNLNENQVAECINESAIYYITEKEQENTNENNIEDNMEMQELMEKFQALENRIEALESENQELKDRLEEIDENKNEFDLEKLANGIQNWIIEEYTPTVQEWLNEHYAEDLKDQVMEEVEDSVDNSELLEGIQNWIVEEFSPEIEKWCINEFAPGIQNWIVEEFSPEVENWLNESYNENVKEQISEAVASSKQNSLSAIDETLKVLESIDAVKPTYSRKSLITENADEPKFIQEMPADARVKWDLASNEVKESITRRAKLYNFVNEGAVERFWNAINFDEIKPVQNVYEGLETIEDEYERNIRAKLRASRFRRI